MLFLLFLFEVNSEDDPQKELTLSDKHCDTFFIKENVHLACFNR